MYYDEDEYDYKVKLDKCPGCGGPADNGHDRWVPPSPYYCTECTEKDRLGEEIKSLKEQ